MDSLRKKTLVGSIWMMFERFGYLTIQFLSNLVLARLLMPEDFGAIGIMMVFIVLSNVFIDSGFSASLIQKKDITEQDKSTVFFTNLTLSVIVYAVLFIASPWIADYFHIEQLRSLLRVLGVVLLIDAFCAIQNTMLTREMNFKRLTQIKLAAIIIAASVAIYLAYTGFGIWALIVQYILYSTIRTSVTWIVAKWRPIIAFSRESFKTLFGFGSKLLLQSFVAQLYINFQQLLIGRFYTPADLGYYSQARQFQQIPTGTVTQVINSVAFPAYSKLQDDRGQLRQIFRQNVQIVAFLNTPIMVLLAVIAQPLIILLYSDKWVGAIQYFQFLCIGYGIFSALHACSLSVLKAVGKSDYVLKLEMIKTILGIGFIMFGLHFMGIWGILYALALNSLIEIFLNGFFVNKELRYNGINLLLDTIPSIVLSSISGVTAYYMWSKVFPVENDFTSILIGTMTFSLVYIIGSWISRPYGFIVLSKASMVIINKFKEAYKSKFKSE